MNGVDCQHMSPELEQRLYDEFPSLYRLRHLDSPKMCCGWRGIRCNDGWFELIRKLSSRITQYAERHHLDPMITGVSASGGALIVEVDCDDDHIHALCREVKYESFHVCEICGEPGKFVTDQPYDIRVSCPKHFVERDDRPLTEGEIVRLRIVNEKLFNIGIEMLEEARRHVELLARRVEDPLDPLDDFEVDAVMSFILREDDPVYREDDDNILTTRSHYIPKKRIEEELESYMDRSWHEGVDSSLLEGPCYLFDDLYCHDSGPGSQRLSMRDILRIGDVWINIDIQAQMFRSLDGKEE